MLIRKPLFMTDNIIMWISIAGAILVVVSSVFQRQKSISAELYHQKERTNDKVMINKLHEANEKHLYTIIGLQSKQEGMLEQINALQSDLVKSANKIAEANKSLYALSSEQNKYSTGGDSYAYIHFWLQPDATSKDAFKYIVTYHILNNGKYPLRNVFVKLHEPMKQVMGVEPYEWSYTLNTLPAFPIQDGPKNSRIIDSRVIDNDESIILYIVEIQSDNDYIAQTTKLYKLKSQKSGYVYWSSATKVESRKHKKLLFENIDKDFPKDKKGKVDYSLSSSFPRRD